MRGRTTVALLLLAGFLGLMAWVLHRRDGPAEGRGASRLIDVPFDRVSRLAIVWREGSVHLEKTRGEWGIVRPVRSRADPGVVHRVLGSLEQMPRLETITSEQRSLRGLTLEDYGLGGVPRVQVTLGDGRTNRTLFVGRDCLDVLYVKFESESEVLATSTNLLVVLPRRTEDLRDRSLLRGDVSRVSRVEIGHAGGGFLQMVNKEGRWLMQQPVKGARLDGQKVSRLLNQLFDLRVERFVPGVDVQQSGLDEAQAAARVTVWTEGENAGQGLRLGKEAADASGEVYAKLADSDWIGAVRRDIVDAVAVRPGDLRDRAVLPVAPGDLTAIRFRDGERKVELRRVGREWQVTEPRHWKADPAVMEELVSRLLGLTVDEFVDGPEGAGSPAHGLAASVRKVDVVTRAAAVEGAPEGAAAAETTRTLVLGAESGGGRGFFARFEDEASVLTLGGEPVRALIEGRYAALAGGAALTAVAGTNAAAPAWVNPLVYCDRVMLELEPAAVTSLSLLKAGREQTVRRDETGQWRPVVPPAGRVSEEVARDMLSAASHLRALRIESQGAEFLPSCGLDKPEATLSFGFSEGRGIRKTLLLGFLAGSDGVYAMLQGQDVVFVLPRRLVGRLLHDLVAEDRRAE